MPSVSSSLRPDDGSSSSRIRGSVASARASSTSRAVPVGKRADHEVGHVADADPIEHLVGHLAGIELGAIPRLARLRGDPHVVERREVRERLELLERAGDPEPGPPERALVGDVDTVEHDLAVGRRLQTGDDVEHRGLAGAVRDR